MTRRRVVLAGWLAFASALTACASGQPAAEVASPLGQPNVESTKLANDWARQTEGAQQHALTDGEISIVEYEDALKAGSDCMRTAGFKTSGVRVVPDGIRRDFTVTQTTQTDDEVNRSWATCRSLHYGAAESVWLLQHKRFDVSGEVLLEELRSCVASAGVTSIPTGAPYYEVSKELARSGASGAAWVCFERYMIYAGKNVVYPK